MWKRCSSPLRRRHPDGRLSVGGADEHGREGHGEGYQVPGRRQVTAAEIRTAVLRALTRVAPEADPQQLDPARPVREQLDLDSIDFMRFLVALRKEVGVDVPESAYAEVASIDGCVAFLAPRISPRSGTA
jgi:acyl carrier protein